MRSVSLRQTKELPRLALLMTLLGSAACASLPPADTAASSPSSAPAVPVAAGAPATPAATIGSIAGAPASGPVAAPIDYRIGPGDLLKLDVFGVPDLNRSVRVNASGQISLPLIGVVQASGQTGEQLAADIAARLAQEYLQNPQVTIFIEEFTSQRVTVGGAVKTPGVFPLKGKTTLLQAVAQAGGPTSVASLGSVKILRPEPDGTRKTLEYDLAAIRDGATPDPEIRGEDVVQVETSAVKETVQQVKEFVLPFWIIAR
jgi:polysaccharide export outer membrane protein